MTVSREPARAGAVEAPRKSVLNECMILSHHLSFGGDPVFPWLFQITQPGMELEPSPLETRVLDFSLVSTVIYFTDGETEEQRD